MVIKYQLRLSNGFIKYNYTKPIGPIYSTKARNDVANGRFNAIVVGGKSDCRKGVSIILAFYSCILINAGFSQIKRKRYKRFLL